MVYIIFFSSSNCTDEWNNNNNIKPVDPYERVNLPEVCPSVLLYAPWGGVSVGRRPSFSQHIAATAAVHPVSCEVPLANKRSKYVYVARGQIFLLNLVNLVQDFELLKYLYVYINKEYNLLIVQIRWWTFWKKDNLIWIFFFIPSLKI